jgi:hypothetical protein
MHQYSGRVVGMIYLPLRYATPHSSLSMATCLFLSNSCGLHVPVHRKRRVQGYSATTCTGNKTLSVGWLHQSFYSTIIYRTPSHRLSVNGGDLYQATQYCLSMRCVKA